MGLEQKSYVNEKIKKYIEMVPEEKYDVAGVYCIKVNEEIVYIGKAKNMRARVATHMYHICDGGNTTPGTKFKYGELATAAKMGYKIQFDVLYSSPIVNEGEKQNDDIGFAEARLINQYMPKLNRQIPNLDNYHRYTNKPYEKLNLKEK